MTSMKNAVVRKQKRKIYLTKEASDKGCSRPGETEMGSAGKQPIEG